MDKVKIIFFFFFAENNTFVARKKKKEIIESKEGEKERESNILLMIHGVPLVGIRRAKNQSSSSRPRLRMGTKNEGFHRRFKEGVITTQIVLFHTLKSPGFEHFLRSNQPN